MDLKTRINDYLVSTVSIDLAGKPEWETLVFKILPYGWVSVDTFPVGHYYSDAEAEAGHRRALIAVLNIAQDETPCYEEKS